MPHRVLHIINNATECVPQVRILVALAESLDRSLYSFDCCFLNGDGPLRRELETIGVPVSDLGGAKNLRSLEASGRLFRLLKSGRFELVHDHYGGLLSRVIAHAAGVRSILHVHSRLVRERDFEPRLRSAKFADAVIATSAAAAECVRSSNIAVIHPGVEVSETVQSSRTSSHTIGTVARLAPVKGLEYLVDAIGLIRQEMSDVRLQIVGTGPSRESLEARVRHLALQEHVEFVGWEPVVRSYLRSWDLFVLPSVEEAFGVSILEAMAEGLPVVATAVGGIPEVVVDGITGVLVPPRDPERLASAILELLRDEKRRNVMSIAALQRVRQTFTRERMVQQIAETYDRVLSRG